ncbi:MAG: hypothetical protein ACK5MT_04770 [Actinomycetales bacterium]
MSAWDSVAVAVIFVWLGMVLAISFLEAPLKFRAPGVTLAIGLGIGRLVFRALNQAESVLAAVLASCVLWGHQSGSLLSAGPVTGAGGISVAMLVAQQVFVRPRLTKRSDAVLAGFEGPRSRAHLAYIGLEVVKVAGLLVAGVLLLSRATV